MRAILSFIAVAALLAPLPAFAQNVTLTIPQARALDALLGHGMYPDVKLAQIGAIVKPLEDGLAAAMRPAPKGKGIGKLTIGKSPLGK